MNTQDVQSRDLNPYSTSVRTGHTSEIRIGGLLRMCVLSGIVTAVPYALVFFAMSLSFSTDPWVYRVGLIGIGSLVAFGMGAAVPVITAMVRK